MENGMAIFERNGAETKAVFIDQDVLKCDRLNKRTENRIAEAAKDQKEDQRIQRKAEKELARFRAFTMKTLKEVLLCGGVIGLAAYGTYSGMIHRAIAIPVILFCLCIASVKAGIWFGRKH